MVKNAHQIILSGHAWSQKKAAALLPSGMENKIKKIIYTKRKMEKDIINLTHGSGGREMKKLIASFNFGERGEWKDCDDDSATLDIGDNKTLVFTTDSFTVNPLFFPGGDIGHLAMCGTINDLTVMGAVPLGLSLAFVIEEGFSQKVLHRILDSIKNISKKTSIPIVTGDTKVMERGKIDKIVINTSGVGIVEKDQLLTKKIEVGDKVIISGGLGEHAVALLSKRFDYKTEIITDSKPLVEEMLAVRDLIKIAKDPTRGGIASILNELCGKHSIGIQLEEEKIPVKQEVSKVVEMLGIDVFQLACEGRFVCVAPPENAEEVEKKLKEFNPDASIIGEIIEDNKVIINTFLGKRILPDPTGRIVPRIC
ncbi:hydrogenase expression/formation protein HypE [Candidatus Woesearchaeota archaeon]|nr:hydrogenase expression/formation protein HypE [Candidatus Woesearchaeota archaeon]